MNKIKQIQNRINDLKIGIKEIFYYDEDLGIPYKFLGYVYENNFNPKLKLEWPDGQISVLDIYTRGLKKIKKEEYEQFVKDYFRHEEFLNQSFEDSKSFENEENENFE